MATEIERKFLLANDDWRQDVYDTKKILQGYLANTMQCSVRVRIAHDDASLNIKSMTIGTSRMEFEYAVPGKDAEEMLAKLCIGPAIEKTRHYLTHRGHTWEIDVFEGENQGLAVAEVELSQPDEDFHRPGWLGEEVTEDRRYYNIALVTHPFSRWLD